MLATCLAAVAGLITSSSAMPRLDSPRAISAVISSSRGVSVVSAPEPAACSGTRTWAATPDASPAETTANLTASCALIVAPSASSAAAAGWARSRPAAPTRPTSRARGRGDGENGKRLELTVHRQALPGGEAELQALVQPGARQPQVALGQRHPADSG